MTSAIFGSIHIITSTGGIVDSMSCKMTCCPAKIVDDTSLSQ